MKRFLWLVVALATMVLVGCANNAGGGTNDGGGGNGNSIEIEGWWKYHAEANGVSLITYIQYDKDGNVLRAGTDKEYTGQYLEMYQVNLTYDKLKDFDNFSKITDESELPSWARNEGASTDDSLTPEEKLTKDLLEWGTGTAIVNGVKYELNFTLLSEQNPLLKLTLTEYRQNVDPYTTTLIGYIDEASGELYFWKRESSNSFETTSPVRIENGSVCFTRGSQIHLRMPDVISFSKGTGGNVVITETIVDRLLSWQEGVASIPQGNMGTERFKIKFSPSTSELKKDRIPINLEIYKFTYPANEYTSTYSREIFVEEAEGSVTLWDVTDSETTLLTTLIYSDSADSVKFEDGKKVYFAWPEVTPITFHKE